MVLIKLFFYFSELTIYGLKFTSSKADRINCFNFVENVEIIIEQFITHTRLSAWSRINGPSWPCNAIYTACQDCGVASYSVKYLQITALILKIKFFF